MREQDTPRTHYLFLRLISLVSQSSAPLTVADLGRVLDIPSEVIAQCIALHLYLERKQVEELPIPPPADYWVPKVADVITRNMLQPDPAGDMPVIDAAIRAAISPGSSTLQVV